MRKLDLSVGYKVLKQNEKPTCINNALCECNVIKIDR